MLVCCVLGLLKLSKKEDWMWGRDLDLALGIAVESPYDALPQLT